MRLQGSSDRGRWIAILAIVLVVVVAVVAYLIYFTPTL